MFSYIFTPMAIKFVKTYIIKYGNILYNLVSAVQSMQIAERYTNQVTFDKQRKISKSRTLNKITRSCSLVIPRKFECREAALHRIRPKTKAVKPKKKNKISGKRKY